SGVSVWAYWRLQPPAGGRGALAGRGVGPAVAEAFGAALQRAVDDRVGHEPATVMMSGGLDSTSVAALAVRRGAPGAVRALTSVHRALPDDQEERFAEAAARSIGIPWDTHPLDGYRLFDRWDRDALPVLPMAEPLTAIM